MIHQMFTVQAMKCFNDMGVRLEGKNILALCDVRATHLPSISIPVLFTSNDACGIVLLYSPARSFGAKVAWILNGGFELLGLFLDVL